MRTLALLGLLLLAGCAAREVPVFDARACPREKPYTKEQQAQMARDLDQTPKSIQQGFVDYLKLRDQARACRRAR